MSFFQETDGTQFPVLESGFTESEISALLSLFEPGLPASPNSGSEVTNRAVCLTEERKRKRMLSNRESARRSRLRKKRHLENLTSQVNRLRLENQDLSNQLGLAARQLHLLQRNNDWLRSEYTALLQRLSDLYLILDAMHPQL
ncbi:bZIP transcription factor 44-like [Malania oleifera]|uniref:bZIP transcription factor 44-like n=1 Tax=Malania oleifera TaxID=397392 RepID=UPI0025AE1062|nr:bZIP transcription factor 44-like [Malania oleifera]